MKNILFLPFIFKGLIERNKTTIKAVRIRVVF